MQSNIKSRLSKNNVNVNSDCFFFLIQVESLPTVIGFKNGRKINKFIGLQEDDAIDSFVEKLIH